MTNVWSRLLAALAAGVFLLTPWVVCEAKAPIRIGAVIPLTGDVAKSGEIQKNSYLMALEEINQAGGIRGRKLELLIEDDSGKPENGVSALEKLISTDKVLVLTGGYSSAVTYRLAAEAQQHKVPYLIHTGAADNITEMGWDFVFRVNQPSSEYFGGLLSFLSEKAKPRTVAIIYENTLFGQSQAKSFSQACRRLGCKQVLRTAYEPGEVDFKPLITPLKATAPDMVYVIASLTDAALLMRQARELDFNPKLFVGGGGGFSLPEFAKTAGDASENVFCATLWSPNLSFPGAREYAAEYEKRFGDTPPFQGAQAYAALFVIADALGRARQLTPDAIRDALTQTDVMTIYGPVKFLSYGKKKQQNQLPTYLGQWQGGVLENVWPRGVATKRFVYPVPPWSHVQAR